MENLADRLLPPAGCQSSSITVEGPRVNEGTERGCAPSQLSLLECCMETRNASGDMLEVTGLDLSARTSFFVREYF